MRTRSTSGPGAAHTGLFGYPRIFMQSAGGAGGGASGQGGAGGEGGGDDDAIPTSKKALTEMMAQIVHNAFTTRSERDKKQRAKEIGEAVTAALQANGLAKKPDEEGDPGAGTGGGDPGVQSGAGHGTGGETIKPTGGRQANPLESQLYRLQKDHEALKKSAAEEKALREKAELAAKRNDEITKLRGVLAGKVKEELLEAAVKLTHDRLVRDPDSDEIMWKGEGWQDREGVDNSAHFQSFDLGLTKWLDGVGKHFAPAKPVGGGGTGRMGIDGKIKGGDGVASDEDIGAFLSSQYKR